MSRLADSPMSQFLDDPRRYEAQHAPKGGVSIAGEFYKGGEWIPGAIADTPEGRAAIKAAEAQPTDAAGSGEPASSAEPRIASVARVSAGPIDMDFGALPENPSAFADVAENAMTTLGAIAEEATGTVRDIFDVGQAFFDERFREIMQRHGAVKGAMILVTGMAGFAVSPALSVAAIPIAGAMGGAAAALGAGAGPLSSAVETKFGGKPTYLRLAGGIGAAVTASPFIAAWHFIRAGVRTGWEGLKLGGSLANRAVAPLEKKLDSMLFPPRQPKAPVGDAPAWVRDLAERTAPHAIHFSAEGYGGASLAEIKELAAAEWQGMLTDWMAHAHGGDARSATENLFTEEESEQFAKASDASDWTEKQPGVWYSPTLKETRKQKSKPGSRGQKKQDEPAKAKTPAAAAPEEPAAAIPVAETTATLNRAYQDARIMATDLARAAQRDPSKMRDAVKAAEEVRTLAHKLDKSRAADEAKKPATAGKGSNPYPAGPGGFEHAAWEEGAAGGYTNGFTPGTPEHKAFKDGAATKGSKVPGTQSGRFTPEVLAKAKGEVSKWKTAAQQSIAKAAQTRTVDAGPVKMDMNKIPDEPQTLLGRAKDIAAKALAVGEEYLVGAPPEMQRAGDNFWQNGLEGIFRAHGIAKGALIVGAGAVGWVAAMGAVNSALPGAWWLAPQTVEDAGKAGGYIASAPFIAASALINRGYYGAKNAITGGSRQHSAEAYQEGGFDERAADFSGVNMDEIKQLAAEEWSKLMAGWYEEAGKVLDSEGAPQPGGMAEGPMEPASAKA